MSQLGLLAPYENRELFSQHFLATILPTWPAWAEARGHAEAARESLRALFRARSAHFPTMKEPQLEHEWVRPVLVALQHVFDVQPPLPTDAATLAPDYALFENDTTLTRARSYVQSKQTPRFWQLALAVGDAKRWGVKFDKRAASKELSPREQLNDYLFRTDAPWGFLTDGRFWRLVHRSTAGKQDRFYEVDLVAALDGSSLDHFLYFWLFFSGQAFRPGADGGRSFLDQARTESIDYAQGVGEELKASVYRALTLLARGYAARGQAQHPALHADCLALLYRLLFLLYAEHRQLLPLRRDDYREGFSLTGLAREVAEGRGGVLLKTGQRLWARLSTTFDLVDQGNDEVGVPAYNGGLFAASEHPLLASGGPGDRDLAEAIDLLARTRKEPRHSIDYRDLDIRHLGTIYEGLLEYQIAIAAVELVSAPEARLGDHFTPFDRVRHALVPESERVRAGEPYLFVDRTERKATGSFYTPDFIVEYLVEETLRPLLAGKSPREILELRVLDPAMGSGHFLLEAIDVLARAYGQARVEAGEDEDGVVSSAELAQYRRLVAEHCIYGIDLNPMAVELAKVALWLKTMATDRPLTFLDNHLHCGNSLLGARIADVDRTGPTVGKKSKKTAAPGAPQQLAMFELAFTSRLRAIMADVMNILGRETKTRADVKMKGEWDATIAELRAPFLAAADVATARYLGHVLHDYVGLLYLAHQPKEMLAHKDVVATLALAQKKRFFHVEMIFPEVFYDEAGQRKSRAGFDAVVGNPPWIRQETVADDKGAFASLYPEVFSSVADIYVYFVAAALDRLAPHGRLGFVLPNKWQRADYGEPLRKTLAETATPVALIDFGHAPIFPDADTFPCLLVVEKAADAQREMQFCAVERDDMDAGFKLPAYVKARGYPVARGQLRPRGWSPVRPEVDRLLGKIRAAGRPLREVTGRKPYYGVKTGLNEAFLVDEAKRRELVAADPGCASVLKKYLRGKDVDRWCARWGGEWMIFARRGINIEAYPSVLAHLLPLRAALEPKPDAWRGDWAGRKPGSYKWFELQDTIDYFEELERPKLIYQEIQFHSCFAVDRSGVYVNNMVHFLPIDDLASVACLNSSLLWWYMWHTAPHKKDEAFGLHGFYMEEVPITEVPSDHATRLIALTAERHAAEDEYLGWLRHQHGLEKPNQKLAEFWSLSDRDFVAELKKCGVRPGPAAQKEVLAQLEASRAGILVNVAEARRLERESHELVFRLYGLTPEEIALVKASNIPRDPLRLLDPDPAPPMP